VHVDFYFECSKSVENLGVYCWKFRSPQDAPRLTAIHLNGDVARLLLSFTNSSILNGFCPDTEKKRVKRDGRPMRSERGCSQRMMGNNCSVLNKSPSSL